jgi:hypothetical protein
MKKLLLVAIVLLVTITACEPGPPRVESPQEQLVREAEDNIAAIYIPKNDLEFENYNRRQLIADDPTTILWCTFFPVTVGQEPFTVPIVGKLTSSGKRPFPKTQVVDFDVTSSRSYNPEVLQPDKMFGSSSEYRFGFTPADFYIDFTDLQSYCTTQPTTWQKNQTTLVMEADSEFSALNEAAQEALKDGDFDTAMDILSSGEWGSQDE